MKYTKKADNKDKMIDFIVDTFSPYESVRMNYEQSEGYWHPASTANRLLERGITSQDVVENLPEIERRLREVEKNTPPDSESEHLYNEDWKGFEWEITEYIRIPSIDDVIDEMKKYEYEQKVEEGCVPVLFKKDQDDRVVALFPEDPDTCFCQNGFLPCDISWGADFPKASYQEYKDTLKNLSEVYDNLYVLNEDYPTHDINAKSASNIKKADNENFDIESPNNIWTVDMFMDNMDSPDGHDNVEFTKIGLIDFLNGEIEEYNDSDYDRLSQNASNEELKEAVYDLLEGKVISIEPYHKIQGSKKENESMKKHIYNNKNIKSYNEREAVDVLFKLEPLDKAGIDGIDVVAWFKYDDPTLCYAHNGQHSTCDPKYMENLEDAKYSDYKYLLQELDNIGYDVTVLNHDYFKGSKINKTAGWRVEKVNENDWIIHTPKGYYVDENDKEYHFSTKEKALEEMDYLRAEHKYEKKSELGFNANPENEEEERVLEIANELENACFNAYKANKWNGWSTPEERQRGIDLAKKALAPLVEKYDKELSDDRFFKMLYRHYEDNNYHTENKALEELTGRKRKASMNRKAYYDEYEEYDSKSPEYIYRLLVNGNITEYKKSLNDMTKKELVQYLRWADEMGIDDSKLNLHYITASNQRIIRKAVRMPGKKYRIDINTVLDVFVGEGTDIIDYKVDNDKLRVKHDYGTETVSLNDCEKAFGLVDGYWKYDSNGNVIGFGGTYQQEDMEEKEASCKKSAKRTMPLRLRRKIARNHRNSKQGGSRPFSKRSWIEDDDSPFERALRKRFPYYDDDYQERDEEREIDEKIKDEYTVSEKTKQYYMENGGVIKDSPEYYEFRNADYILIPSRTDKDKYLVVEMEMKKPFTARRKKAGESYGWVVDSADAYDALDKFVDAYGTEEALDAITRAMGRDELADNLAYIFREYDFKEGCSDYEDDEEYEEEKEEE